MSENLEVEVATPAGQGTGEQVQSDASISSESSTEQTQEVSQETQEQTEQAKKEPWFQKRINEQTRKYYEAQREAQALKDRLAQYEQRQYQAPEDEQYQQSPVNVETLAEQKAAQMLAERSFNDQCNKVYEAGSKELPDFNAAVSNLQFVGVNRDFLEAVTATDAGHKILHHLGQLDNLPEAERILNLPPVQMGRELAKLEIKLSQPIAKPVSKAPAPITPIGASGATDSGIRDDIPIEEWMRRRMK